MGTSRRPRWQRKIRPVSRWLPGFARLATIILLVFLSIFVALRVAGPYLISTGLVRSGIEDALSKWAGYRAEIAGKPVIEFWPTPRITLNKISVHQQGDGNRLLGTIESLSAEFSLIDAIRGRASFHEFHLLRPTLQLTRESNGVIDWTNEGLLARAIAGAREEGGREVLDKKLDAAVGAITVEDGTVNVADVASGRTFRFDGVTADVSWRKLSSPITAVLIARTSGQDLKLDFSSPSPLLIFGGNKAEMSGSLTSSLLTARFQGLANISHFFDLSGNMSLSIGDLPALLTWADRSLPVLATLKSFSIETDVASVSNGFRFDNVSMSMNGSNAKGVMDVAFPPGRRAKLGGTLAFDQMNFRSLFDAFILRLAAGEANGPPDGGALQKLDLDLRLSAKQALIEPFMLSDVGASIIVSSNEAKFDIGDGQFEGGALSAHLEAMRGDFDGGGKLQLSIRGADFAGLIERLQLKGPLPLTTGSLDMSLKTSVPLWKVGAGDVTGRIAFHARSGSLPGFDAEAVREEATRADFFPLNAVSHRAFAFDSFDIVADLADGAATIHGGRIEGPQQTIILSGVIPYRSNGLALSGTIEATDPTASTSLPPLPFFVGGAWPEPVISPAPVTQQGSTK
ncbi:cell envelope biogenesis protein AsmA [Rhizobium sp. R72]|uniref:AsmA family protein n=1 Tax=unclassified Rhizobium TaxID=2613769 RepID=UPI000B52E2AB|nr:MULTISPECIES: AsmA-like C-terminal region-containing protein [unclassified Rhizobium]OWV84907.1 cell envelope biogenesis protein AsmA [Rhizobium sp. R693]OWV95008.1 cell envelope biogenesis protein AsmA [Rhizobium sp. R72]OWV95248.1 cell envelope biogenesis protein AsmA [Rhizobium sp. R711]